MQWLQLVSSTQLTVLVTQLNTLLPMVIATSYIDVARPSTVTSSFVLNSRTFGNNTSFIAVPVRRLVPPVYRYKIILGCNASALVANVKLASGTALTMPLCTVCMCIGGPVGKIWKASPQ